MENNIEKISLLIKNKKFSEAVDTLNNLDESEKNNPNYYFLKGISYLYLNNKSVAAENFTQCLKLNSNNPTFYFYRGYTYSRLNDFEKTIEDYQKAISLKPNAPEFYNNLGGVYYTIGENEKAIEHYIKSLELKKDLKPSLTGLLNVLSQTRNINVRNSEIVLAHNNINNIKLEYSPEKNIEDFEIKELFEKINLILKNNANDLEFDKVQTYREQQLPPHCNRHKKIFSTLNFIPKHCFECYKIQIEVDNVLELMKLYIVFDKIKLEKDNSRKCMIELRPGVSGNYKGLIFCNSIQETEIILNKVKKILYKNFNKELNCKIKRGCSEYYPKFPNYNKLDKNAMIYDEKNKEQETNFDEKNPDLIFDKNSNPTIEGLSLFDALVFRNWLSFARMIGDDSHKKISDQIFHSRFVENQLKIKLKNN